MRWSLLRPELVAKKIEAKKYLRQQIKNLKRWKFVKG